jgi:methylenetetrahydrofolate--tRNA-(uracil-5-)-methyltransferase
MNRLSGKTIDVIGAGLAGCEAAWAIAGSGFNVRLFEMKPEKYSPAHKYHGFAELVCSNSLKAEQTDTAAGLLKEEMRRLGSLTVSCAEETRVDAGGALAVDRELFSNLVTKRIKERNGIEIITREVTAVPDGVAVVATGPLTAGELAKDIERLCGGCLSFFDAAAPIVTAESIDMEKTFFASRYGHGPADYLNCPLTEEEYVAFREALTSAQTAPLRDFDSPDGKFPYYEGCIPVEALAKRGRDTLRFGCLKPVGLTDPRTGFRPYACVQLRRENGAGTLYNIVGFQTNLKYGEQKRVFSLIPGLEQAEYARYGVMHRASFIDSPRLLNADFSLRSNPALFFAGQLTGAEGYMESAASGILAGLNAARFAAGSDGLVLPAETMTGALSRYISDETVAVFRPMGANMGILPELGERVKTRRGRRRALADRALEKLSDFRDMPHLC